MADNKRKVTQLEKEVGARTVGVKDWVVVDQSVEGDYSVHSDHTPLTEEEYQALQRTPGTQVILVKRIEAPYAED